MVENAGFLGRWSRRKLDAKDGKPLAPEPVALLASAASPTPPAPSAPSAPVVVPSAMPPLDPGLRGDDSLAPASDQPAPLPTLQDAQALTPESDFKPFMAKGVTPEVKNAAMKKLFADPHFNVMDGLDTYIEDYSRPDPLPASMLRQMVSAKFLKFFDEEDEEEERKKAVAEKPLEPRDDADTPVAPVVAQSDLCKPLPSQPVSPALAASQPHDAHTDLRLQPDDAPAGQEPGRSAG